ncbi:hypothetical protein GCM10011506_03810 [Marivirga lumbricoides]|uniref:Uncharacterized protein n=1 Tax=Marivirga lumbricoides TaxID=1046115 RepID=A0ABQ1LF27_9BACT|nr:hypothetical protein GCM10011506_03810 [Marivirga lumbricoides]
MHFLFYIAQTITHNQKTEIGLLARNQISEVKILSGGITSVKEDLAIDMI